MITYNKVRAIIFTESFPLLKIGMNFHYSLEDQKKKKTIKGHLMMGHQQDSKIGDSSLCHLPEKLI